MEPEDIGDVAYETAIDGLKTAINEVTIARCTKCDDRIELVAMRKGIIVRWCKCWTLCWRHLGGPEGTLEVHSDDGVIDDDVEFIEESNK